VAIKTVYPLFDKKALRRDPRRRDRVKLWIKALRSGKYKQGRSALKEGNKWCCLGVMIDVLEPKGWRNGMHRLSSDETMPTTNACRLFGLQLGLNDSDESAAGFLADKNDGDTNYRTGRFTGRWSFDRIADALESSFKAAMKKEA
jgi:hypothetical protein